MEDKRKANIQRVIDLLEENGFHVNKAEEEEMTSESGIVRNFFTGIISLRITPKEEEENR